MSGGAAPLWLEAVRINIFPVYTSEIRAGSHKRDENNRFLSMGRGVAQERFLTVVAGFVLGYVTAVLFHRRINGPERATWLRASGVIRIRRHSGRCRSSPQEAAGGRPLDRFDRTTHPAERVGSAQTRT